MTDVKTKVQEVISLARKYWNSHGSVYALLFLSVPAIGAKLVCTDADGFNHIVKSVIAK